MLNIALFWLNIEMIKINTSRSIRLYKINDRPSVILTSASQLHFFFSHNTADTFHTLYNSESIFCVSTIPADYSITVYTSARCCHIVVLLCNIEIKKSTLHQLKRQTDHPTLCCHISAHVNAWRPVILRYKYICSTTGLFPGENVRKKKNLYDKHEVVFHAPCTDFVLRHNYCRFYNVFLAEA